MEGVASDSLLCDVFRDETLDFQKSYVALEGEFAPTNVNPAKKRDFVFRITASPLPGGPSFSQAADRLGVEFLALRSIDRLPQSVGLSYPVRKLMWF